MNQYTRIRAAATTSLLLLCGSFLVSAALAQPPARVKVSEVVEENAAATNSFVATIMPLKRVTIGSAVNGRVAERLVEIGDRVESKKPLFKLLTNTINLELAAAKAELAVRQEELNELENGTRPAEIEQAKAKMLAAQASAKYAQLQRERLQTLWESNSIPKNEFDAAVAAHDQAQQNYFDLKAAYELSVEGPRKEQIDRARALVNLQKAEIARIEDRITKYTIISRFNGYVVARHVEIGAWVKTGDPIVDVIELDNVELQAYVAEQHSSHIHPGVSVPVIVPSISEKPLDGATVKSVVPQADARARTVPVLISMENKITDGVPLFKSGMVAKVDLPVESPRNALFVPKDALVLGGRTPLVFVIVPGDETGSKKAVPVPVEMGVSKGNKIEIKGDIAKGQLVAVEGNERLRPNQAVIVAGQQ